MYAHVHLVAIGQSALSRALVPVDIVEIGAHILFRLSSRDLHGLGPGAFAFADHERVTGMVSHLKHVLFVRLPALHGAGNFVSGLKGVSRVQALRCTPRWL